MVQRHYKFSKEKNERINAIIAILLLIITLILVWLLPDQGSEKIKQFLEERGYVVSNIDFTCTKKLSNIYISSQPIEVSKGVTCEYWQLVSYGTTGVFQTVFPYPDGWPEPVNVSITFEPEEYQELLNSAGNESIESYIKDKLLTEKPE